MASGPENKRVFIENNAASQLKFIGDKWGPNAYNLAFTTLFTFASYPGQDKQIAQSLLTVISDRITLETHEGISSFVCKTSWYGRIGLFRMANEWDKIINGEKVFRVFVESLGKAKNIFETDLAEQIRLAAQSLHPLVSNRAPAKPLYDNDTLVGTMRRHLFYANDLAGKVYHEDNG